MSEYSHFETLQVHAGRKSDPETGSCATPLYQTASYTFKSIEHAARLFELKEDGYIYSRLSNPTTEVLEKRIAALEGGTAAVAVSSGQAAHLLTFQNIASPGDNVVCASSLYGGSYTLFNNSLRHFGIDFRFTGGKEAAYFERLTDSGTKALFAETIGNSDYFVPDFEALADICHKAGIPLIIDNTFGGGGYLFRPLDYGASIVTHSATKWIGGHGNSIAGIVVDGGNFNWDNGRFPEFTEDCASYHGLNFWKSFGGWEPGQPNTAFATRARALGLRDLGCCLAPFNALLILQGTETLSLRMQRAMDNTQELAEWLVEHPKVESVNYPGLKDNPSYANARRYFKKGFGAVLSFAVKGSREETARFVERLGLITHLVNVGDNKTLIAHPASTTHGQMSPDALRAAGIGPGTLRLAVGIEHIDDLKADLEESLNKL